jgi:2-keto-3-deoxy-L-rhamnonate aldolase RhmA
VAHYGPNDILTLIGQIQTLKDTPAVPLMRAAWNDIVLIKRILGTGAYGILFPYINTPTVAEATAAPPPGAAVLMQSLQSMRVRQQIRKGFLFNRLLADCA